MPADAPPAAAEKPADESQPRALSPLEIESIDLFINFVRLLGMPKSIGEIYGLLFVAPEALPLDAMMERLHMSKGAASQGLKQLRSFGAVKMVYVAGDRRDHYVANLDLSRFASNFIEDELQPHFENGLVRLARMEKILADLPEAERAATNERMAKLRHWKEKGQAMMPLILKFLVS